MGSDKVVDTSVTVLSQYGALGIIALFLMVLVGVLLFYFGKQHLDLLKQESEEKKKRDAEIAVILGELRSAISSLVLITEKTSAHYDIVINHERLRSEDCYDKVVHTLGDILKGQNDVNSKMESFAKDINNKLETIEKHTVKCNECAFRSRT